MNTFSPMFEKFEKLEKIEELADLAEGARWGDFGEGLQPPYLPPSTKLGCLGTS